MRISQMMELDGAVRDEFGCFGGGRLFFDKNLNRIEKKDAKSDSLYVEAIWCKGDYAWTYKTNIPNIVEFDVIDEGYKYCRGFVFSINDLA